MKVVIAGAGGVGGYLGVRLSEAGHEVAYLARGRRLAALREHGISLHSPLGEVTLGPQQASEDAAALGPADAVIVTVKLYDLEALAGSLAVLQSRLVLPLENGVEAHGILARALAPVRPLHGMVSIKSSLEGERIRLGAHHAEDDAPARALAAVLNEAKGVEAVVSSDIERDVWMKFVMLASFSAVSCMARATIGAVLDNAQSRALVLEAATEAAAVARARGVALPEDIAEITMQQVADMPRQGRPSMLEDLEAGRPLELPWLSGAVARLGQAAGVPTPIHSVACRALAMHVAGAGR